MWQHLLLVLVCLVAPQLATSQPKIENIIAKWRQSTSHGYCNIRADVTAILYDKEAVYVTTNGIPSYPIGPWPPKSFTPTAQNATYKFPRMPCKAVAGQRCRVKTGAVGLLINGQAIYSAHDEAKPAIRHGYWSQDANFTAAKVVDRCNGHADKSGRYHTHTNPVCLYDARTACVHSPLLGFAFDGFPIYGPFGYANPLDAKSPVKRMMSSYTKRNVHKRKWLADGTMLKSGARGPKVSHKSPVGRFVEDYEFIEKLGDLDEFNGRRCVTPDFPQGTYAYFVSTDYMGSPAYPYTVGPYFYGRVERTRPVKNVPKCAVRFF